MSAPWGSLATTIPRRLTRFTTWPKAQSNCAAWRTILAPRKGRSGKQGSADSVHRPPRWQIRSRSRRKHRDRITRAITCRTSLSAPSLQYTSGSFPEQPKNQGQQETKQQAGEDREVKTEIALRVMNVSGQAAQPPLADSRPKQNAGGGDK